VQVVSRDIRNLLTARAKYFNLLLDDVSITNLTFSREYTGAVEAKQVAQQESERAKFIVSLTHKCMNLLMSYFQQDTILPTWTTVEPVCDRMPQVRIESLTFSVVRHTCCESDAQTESQMCHIWTVSHALRPD